MYLILLKSSIPGDNRPILKIMLILNMSLFDAFLRKTTKQDLKLYTCFSNVITYLKYEFSSVKSGQLTTLSTWLRM